MKIGIIDIDCHAAKKQFVATIYPNLALCKIAAYHKAQGNSVEWATPFEEYDILYMSKIFNFSEDDRRVYHAKQIIKGGTGYDVYSKLPEEIDRMQPDYSIYPHIPENTSYGFLTRGCPNKCGWCVVPKKEGAIHHSRIMYWWRKNQELRKTHTQRRVYPYAQPYRDPFNHRAEIPQWQKDMAGWCNKKMIFESIPFEDFEPRKGFTCKEYLHEM